MNRKLRVVVMTQADRFFIPKNIARAADVCEILEIVEVNCKSALENRLSDYYKWFGPWQCARMGAVTVAREAERQSLVTPLSRQYAASLSASAAQNGTKLMLPRCPWMSIIFFTFPPFHFSTTCQSH